MKLMRHAVVVSLLAATFAACAPRVAPLAPVGPPRYPEFPFPTVPLDLAATAVMDRHNGAWQYLQAGDLRAAERGFAAAVRQAPHFYPAETGLAYVEMAQRRYREAILHFDRALALEPAYVPALLGRGEALLATNQGDAALASFEAALATDPSLAEVGSRVEVLRFRRLQEQIARARRALEAGEDGEARQAYQHALAASPESAFLHRELAQIEQRSGDLMAALSHARRAAELDAQDARTHALLGAIHEARGEYDEALTALGRARALDPAEISEERIQRLRARIELARLPAEYRAISHAPSISRGDLAALIGIRLEGLLQQTGHRPPIVMTDARGHWAAPWIQTVTRAGVMEVYPNHTFQPGATIRRGDLAMAASRLLGLIAARDPVLARSWRDARPKFSDLGPGHLSYPAAALAVQAGILRPLDGDTFQLSRPVSGAEVEEAISRLEAFARQVR
jgi:tetratricopeptide (TPR) repeat protein